MRNQFLRSSFISNDKLFKNAKKNNLYRSWPKLSANTNPENDIFKTSRVKTDLGIVRTLSFITWFEVRKKMENSKKDR